MVRWGWNLLFRTHRYCFHKGREGNTEPSWAWIFSTMAPDPTSHTWYVPRVSAGMSACVSVRIYACACSLWRGGKCRRRGNGPRGSLLWCPQRHNASPGESCGESRGSWVVGRGYYRHEEAAEAVAGLEGSDELAGLNVPDLRVRLVTACTREGAQCGSRGGGVWCERAYS